jgi:hypothetical protein
VFGLSRSRNDDADTRPTEPKTVPETQRWLNCNGYGGACTEDNAKHQLFARWLVREGRVHEDKR